MSNSMDKSFNALLTSMNKGSRDLLTRKVHLFRTDAKERGLTWENYLNRWSVEDRQYHNCNSCRHFVEQYGDLAVVDSSGGLVSAVWFYPESQDPYKDPTYRDIFKKFREVVSESQITGLFVPDKSILGEGRSVTSAWNHLFIELPHQMVDHSHKSSKIMAEKLESFKTVNTALKAYRKADIESAVTILNSGSIYRPERFLEPARWLLEAYGVLNRPSKLWEMVAGAPEGFCHPRSSVIGSMIEDISNGLSTSDIIRHFNSKVDSGSYQRAQVAPEAGNIQQAEKIIQDLGIATSLKRRPAQYSELPESSFLWRSHVPVVSGGVFSHITPKKAQSSSKVDLPETTMTWVKFRRDVLPNATNIELKDCHGDRRVSLMTAEDPQSPPILQWDNEGDRNPFSWSYSRGIDSDIKRRVVGAGGQYENCDIRCSLAWDNRNDLDLHCMTPDGSHIYFSNKVDRKTGGYLDIDMNVSGETTKPVENIRWSSSGGRAKEGQYTFYVQNFRFHEPFSRTSFRVELEVNGKIYTGEGSVPAVMGDRSNTEIAVFHFRRNTVLGNPFSRNIMVTNSVTPSQDFVKVKGIVPSPNLWGSNPQTRFGNHTIFLLDRNGVVDNAQGFYTETLRGDLYPIRSTLEAYAKSQHLARDADADTFGVGMVDQTPWDLVLKVNLRDGTHRQYRIDRFE